MQVDLALCLLYPFLASLASFFVQCLLLFSAPVVITFLKFHQHLVTKEPNTGLLDFHEDTPESCSRNTCSRILFYLDAGGKRIRCPGATSGRFLVTHGPPKAVRVNKTLVPTIADLLLPPCHSIFVRPGTYREIYQKQFKPSQCPGSRG